MKYLIYKYKIGVIFIISNNIGKYNPKPIRIINRLYTSLINLVIVNLYLIVIKMIY